MHVKLLGEVSWQRPKVSVEVFIGSDVAPSSSVTWQASYEGKSKKITVPHHYKILSMGEGYELGDNIIIGESHTATVDAVCSEPKGGINNVIVDCRGEYTSSCAVSGGNGKGAEICFPKSECPYESGMIIRVHITKSSKNEKCFIKFLIEEEEERGKSRHSFFFLTPQFYVTSTVKKLPLFLKKVISSSDDESSSSSSSSDD